MYDLITILGPTACGKTAVATRVARAIGGEIVSADSRQVFRGMDIGTGKDLTDYGSGADAVPYHLIDTRDAGESYSVYDFQRDFLQAYTDIRQRGKVVVLCGGTGLYIESVLRAYRLVEVPANEELRTRLEGLPLEELTRILATYKRLHNTTDVDTARRAIRAIEIADFYERHPAEAADSFPTLCPLTIGLTLPRELRRQRITERLHARLATGMEDEVRGLLARGVAAEALLNYGLEYRYITLHLTGRLTREQMVKQLETAIHQFAKRQMTYFRGMERRGVSIRWVDASKGADAVAACILEQWDNDMRNELHDKP